MQAIKRPPEQLTDRAAAEPPKELVSMLKRLWRPLDILGDRVAQQTVIGWDLGAGEVYQAFSGKLDALEAVNSMKYQLGQRVCENSVRLATDMACGRGSSKIELEDIQWALKVGELSFDTSCSNYEKYVNDFYKFPVLCRKIWEALLDRAMPEWEIERMFGRNQRFGNEVERAMKQLKKERRIKEARWRNGERGPFAVGWEGVPDDVVPKG